MWFVLLLSVMMMVAAEAADLEDHRAMIDKIRKSDIHIRVVQQKRSADEEEPIQIRVRQVARSFPFGTAVNGKDYHNPSTPQCYRDLIHQHFNWAVLENDLKWDQVEPQRNHTNYQVPVAVMHALKNHNIKMRCHNLVWSVDGHVPGWVKLLQGQELRQVVQHHINDIMAHTKGLCEHWDVNNENLPMHGLWYQNRLHDPDYDLELFRIAHRADPLPRLFLNDYEVVTGGLAEEYKTQGLRFKSNNVHLAGMGCQCHFFNESAPNPTSIKHHLDILSAVGVPLWATELDVRAVNVQQRAHYYELALTALFAHPHVEGILLWGFWDHNMHAKTGALVNGNTCQINAAGQRVFELVNRHWQSDEVVTVTDESEYTVRGFHGDYEVEVIKGGKVLRHLTSNFSLGKGPQTLTIHI